MSRRIMHNDRVLVFADRIVTGCNCNPCDDPPPGEPCEYLVCFDGDSGIIPLDPPRELTYSIPGSCTPDCDTPSVVFKATADFNIELRLMCGDVQLAAEQFDAPQSGTCIFGTYTAGSCTFAYTLCCETWPNLCAPAALIFAEGVKIHVDQISQPWNGTADATGDPICTDPSNPCWGESSQPVSAFFSSSNQCFTDVVLSPFNQLPIRQSAADPYLLNTQLCQAMTPINDRSWTTTLSGVTMSCQHVLSNDITLELLDGNCQVSGSSTTVQWSGGTVDMGEGSGCLCPAPGSTVVHAVDRVLRPSQPLFSDFEGAAKVLFFAPGHFIASSEVSPECDPDPAVVKTSYPLLRVEITIGGIPLPAWVTQVTRSRAVWSTGYLCANPNRGSYSRSVSDPIEQYYKAGYSNDDALIGANWPRTGIPWTASLQFGATIDGEFDLFFDVVTAVINPAAMTPFAEITIERHYNGGRVFSGLCGAPIAEYFNDRMVNGRITQVTTFAIAVPRLGTPVTVGTISEPIDFTPLDNGIAPDPPMGPLPVTLTLTGLLDC